MAQVFIVTLRLPNGAKLADLRRWLKAMKRAYGVTCTAIERERRDG